jgi:hypothetical protein
MSNNDAFNRWWRDTAQFFTDAPTERLCAFARRCYEDREDHYETEVGALELKVEDLTTKALPK